ncbi:MAG: Uma2 family endonuclease, partial [Planctomycetota bacterium]
ERFRDGRFPRTGYPTVAPDLVVEILSPGNTAGEMRQKRENFFAAGSRVVWQIDPLTETAETFAQGEPHRPTAVPAGGTLDAGDALPGFRLALPDLFTDDLREAGADA